MHLFIMLNMLDNHENKQNDAILLFKSESNPYPNN